jgi:hypothetical protein
MRPSARSKAAITPILYVTSMIRRRHPSTDSLDLIDQDGIYPDPERGGFMGPESCGIIAPPNVVSTSYGADEADFTVSYAMRQCAEYGKLGMMGTTVLYSSGV